MKIRADIAELLRAGHPESHIASELRVSPKTVRAARRALGMPDPPRGKPASTLEEAFRAHTEEIGDGHVRWTGYVDAASGTPVLSCHGRRLAAPKAAFLLHHEREPVGKPAPTCGMTDCIAGAHLADRPMREALRRTEVARLLRAGQLSQAEIARQAGVCQLTVQHTREALGLPAPKRGRHLPKYPTLESAFAACTQPVDGGHLQWTGRVDGNAPVLRYGGTEESVYRIAFREHTGREPEGRVRSECEVPRCVAGPCLTDRVIRASHQRADAAFEAIFGDPT
ncbi:hypothetical protein ACFVP3_23385 [Streptomyces sp. NPDC057806]|uniref:hypothetical protein n=1 Tax=Streptomyces sp. NPDC057806 TaxID=3346255 RepID=UPI0036C9F15A